MRIPRIHHAGDIVSGDVIALDQQASRHLLRVLRMAPGAVLVLFNGRGGEYEARLDRVAGNHAMVAVERFVDCTRESPLRVTLGQGIARGERMDYILQKAVELGVARIVPLFTERCEVRLTGERLQNRLRHWQALVAGACEQSGRTTLPVIGPPLPLDVWIADAEPSRSDETSSTASAPVKLVLDPDACQSLSGLRNRWQGNEILLLSGPEGGLTAAETSLSEQAGFCRTKLGPRILRAETAPVAALAILQALWGDLA